MEQREIIRIEGLTKRFSGKNGDVVALENIDLSINVGEIFGIIGLSGAGKSTLVRCINLLERPTEGRVTVAGQELSALKGRQLREARRGIGMIFQQFNLLMQRTAWMNSGGWKKISAAQIPRRRGGFCSRDGSSSRKFRRLGRKTRGCSASCSTE